MPVYPCNRKTIDIDRKRAAWKASTCLTRFSGSDARALRVHASKHNWRNATLSLWSLLVILSFVSGCYKGTDASVREIVKSLDPTQIGTPQTIWESLESEAEQMRSLARIILVMASIALLLAITGVYAVLSFAVSQRAREFGIRMVMGANRKAIFQSIVLRGFRQIAIGLVFGLAVAEPALWSLTRLLKHSPLPLRIFDTSVYAIAAVLLVVVSLLAMCLPAFRATEVDPIKALRTE